MNDKRLLTYEDAAESLSCSAAKVKKMVLAGEIPHVKLGNHMRRIPRAAIQGRYVGPDPIRAQKLSLLPKGAGVYFLLSPTVGLTKIGYAKNLTMRIASYRTDNAEELAVALCAAKAYNIPNTGGG